MFWRLWWRALSLQRSHAALALVPLAVEDGIISIPAAAWSNRKLCWNPRVTEPPLY